VFPFFIESGYSNQPEPLSTEYHAMPTSRETTPRPDASKPREKDKQNKVKAKAGARREEEEEVYFGSK